MPNFAIATCEAKGFASHPFELHFEAARAVVKK
jgi:hypothetical protein